MAYYRSAYKKTGRPKGNQKEDFQFGGAICYKIKQLFLPIVRVYRQGFNQLLCQPQDDGPNYVSN